MNSMDAISTFMFASVNGKGSFITPITYLAYGAAGIAVAELLKQGKIKFDGKVVTTVNSSSTGNEILDGINALIEKKSSYKLQTLIATAPYYIKRFKNVLIENLEDNGLVRIEEYRFLGLIPYKKYSITKVNQHEKLIQDLKNIVLKDEKSASPERAFIVTLFHYSFTLTRLFDKTERKQAKEKFKMIGKGTYFSTLSQSDHAILKAIKYSIAASHAATS